MDDVHGYDFAYGDGNPMDDNGHGTHVAGTIGAVGNNGTGIVGVNWSTRIMALKFLDSSGGGYTSNAIKAIDYAVANGAKVSNNSWGGGGYSQSLYTAIQNARNAGHVFIAAAGNEGRNNDSTPSYPASYDLANIVSVAATDRFDRLASFSNYGARSVDLAAPGVDIVSTVPGGYAYMSGTSMAAPHVSGVVALVWGQNPGWSYKQVIDRVLTTGDAVSALATTTATGKRLNAAAALATTNRAPVAADDSASVLEDSSVRIAVLANDSDPDGNALTPVLVSGPSTGQVTLNSDRTFTYTPKPNFNGSDSFKYKVNDGTADSNTATVSITVAAVNDAPVAANDAASTAVGRAVTVSVLATGLISGSALVEVTDDEPPPQVQILDNGDAGFSTAGDWTLNPRQGHQSDIHCSAEGTGVDVATWTFSGLQAGTYQVAATWNAHLNRATDSPFRALDGTSLLGTVRTNQELKPDDFSDAGANWETLGEFTIQGDTLVLQLSDAANEYVIADAIRIEKIDTAAALQLESSTTDSLMTRTTAEPLAAEPLAHLPPGASVSDAVHGSHRALGFAGRERPGGALQGVPQAAALLEQFAAIRPTSSSGRLNRRNCPADRLMSCSPATGVWSVPPAIPVQVSLSSSIRPCFSGIEPGPAESWKRLTR